MLWQYWIDEASADVYGVLNIGPSFGVNLGAFFAALRQRSGEGFRIPQLSMQSGDDLSGRLDVHPTDILRLSLVAGVVDVLTGLRSEVRQQYRDQLDGLAQLCATGDEVAIQGHIFVERDSPKLIDVVIPLTVMRQAALRVGGLIASTVLAALGGHSIQEIETWDDQDEAIAVRISQALVRNDAVLSMGDDAQLLAGATLALMNDPGLYDNVTTRLNDALDQSFANDPFWGELRRDMIFARYSQPKARR